MMTLTYRRQSRATLSSKLCVSLASVLITALAHAEETPVEQLRARIEGIYILEEWHRHGEVSRPPLVDARTVLLNGRIMFIARESGTNAAGYGVYTLEAGKFAYRYDAFTVITQTTSGASVSEALPWEGLRTFAVSIENNEVRFSATKGPQEFRFSENGLTYSDGIDKRVYRRASAK